MRGLPSKIHILDKDAIKLLPPNQPVIVLGGVDGMRPELYALHSGIPVNTVRKMLSDGRLPRIKKDSPNVKGGNSTVLGNVMKLAVQALEASY